MGDRGFYAALTTAVFLVLIVNIMQFPGSELAELFAFYVFVPSLVFLISLVIYWNTEGSIRYYSLSFSLFTIVTFLINLYHFAGNFVVLKIDYDPEPLKLFALIPVISAGSYLYPAVWKYLKIKDIALALLISSALVIGVFYPFIPITLQEFYSEPMVFILALLIFMAIFINSFFISVYRGATRTLMVSAELSLILLFLAQASILYRRLLGFEFPLVDISSLLEELAFLTLLFGFYRVYSTSLELPSIELLEREILEYRQKLESITGYKKFFENAEDFLFRLDIEGRFVDVNSKIGVLLGYEEEDIIGTRFLRLVAREDRKIMNQKFSSVLKGNREKFRLRIIKKRGDLLHMDVLMWPWIERSTLKGVEGIARDVSDLIEAEENVRNLNEYLTILNKILRHDVQNDIAVIRMYIDLAKEGEDIDIATAMEKIDDRVNHALSTIKDVKEIERMLSVGELVGVNLSMILTKRIQEFSKDAKITYSIPRNIYVEADSAINSVLHNIIQNAIFHNDKEVVEIDIKVEEKDDKIYVRIADNGPGIPDSLKEMIFRESFKGETTGRSGLGLYLVKETMKRYGGNVWVEDNIPYGSVFVLEFKRSEISEDFQRISGVDLE